jgi:phosphonate transport system permease protein
VALALVALVAGSFAALDLGLAGLLTADAAAGVADFLAQFLRPDLSPEWLAKVGRGALETLAISACGSLLAALAGALLALPAAGRFGAPVQTLARFALNGLRAVPELVWATLTALAAGLGPLAGALALALHTAGVLGRLYGEALENAPEAPAQALRQVGAGPVAAFCYGTLPQVAPQWLAYGLYRWEINIRMAAVLGFVGAGGLGQALYFSLSLFHYAEAATLIAAMLVLSAVVDAASGALRRRLG